MSDIVFRYLGGAFIHGVPARDLTAAEAAQYGVDADRLIKRLVLIIDEGVITHVFYPVFPPDQSAADVLAWLAASR